ncbi:hypothetical protein EB796_010816 [Bugula neritina]|uniref:Uncharacterized protein n=1 Tax=Bugula neritina TaxID=10212 RepID=A0A7J7JY40_BUGNE|nr:hypothetical protein EB796_010816 [Bugula neritina]
MDADSKEMLELTFTAQWTSSEGSPLSPEEADNIKEYVNKLRSAREETASTVPEIGGEKSYCINVLSFPVVYPPQAVASCDIYIASIFTAEPIHCIPTNLQ